MILVIDTETDGLPKKRKAPITDLDNWPRLVQLAWGFYGAGGVCFGQAEHIIKPDNFTIPARAAKVHGITTDIANLRGIPLREALSRFTAAVEAVGCLVAHNFVFDRNILGAEFLRCGMEDVLSVKPHICTMKESTNHCKLRGRRGYKWPRLGELYFVLFGQEMGASHNALVDTEATAACFARLVQLGVIEYP